MQKVLFPLIGLAVLLYGCTSKTEQQAKKHVIAPPIEQKREAVFTEDELQDIENEIMELFEETEDQDPPVVTTDEDAVNALMQLKDVNEDEEQIEEVDDTRLITMLGFNYEYQAALEDVDEGPAFGSAKADIIDGAYHMVATFLNLPEPEGTDFYEGWIVRKKPFHFVSTGRVEDMQGVLINTYVSAQDLLDHDMYVLTIEPDDGDPAPADHVLEGTFLPAE